MEHNEETVLIGCLLAEPTKLCLVAHKIKPEYFSDNTCKLIYNTMLNNHNYSPVIIANKTKLNLADLLDLARVFNIVDDNKINQYAFGVLEKWKKRQKAELIKTADVDELADKLKEIDNIVYFDESNINASQVFLQNAEDRYTRKPDLRNVPTGYASIDKSIKGFRKTEFVILGGRPGAGKTTIGMNIALRMAEQGQKVLFCSLEMSEVELHERIVKSMTGISDFENMNKDEWDKLVKASRNLQDNIPLRIYDKPGMTIEDIIRKSYQKKPDVVFIDHLSILRTNRNFNGNRYAEVSYMTARLKVLARELEIPVVCLCQLNRQVEGRDVKAPNLSDLRDSGSIEQDADIVSFIYRPEYHLKMNEPDKDSPKYIEWEEKINECKNKGYFIVAKNRRGWIGRKELYFDGPTYKFGEL